MEKSQVFPVNELPIRLGQFLKLANLVQDGFEAKVRIQYEEVLINGEIETRRGRKLVAGDTVEFGGNVYILSAQPQEADER